LSNNLKAMTARMEKNEGPGGAFVNTIAYQSEFVDLRAKLAAAERAIAKNNCAAPSSQ
jgi:hypothetical protein